MSKEKNVIVSPHCDDELIGCYEILGGKKCTIIYDPSNDRLRREEALNLRKHFSNITQLFLQNFPSKYANHEVSLFFPDPSTEIHPLHRHWGSVGEQLARSGYDVTFYTTNMNAPYIHEVTYSKEKETVLNDVYPSQSDLWKYEKKYILFEGRCKWIF